MTENNVNKYTYGAATRELARYVARLKMALKDTDPAVTGEILLWVAALEGVVNFMKEEINEQN